MGGCLRAALNPAAKRASVSEVCPRGNITSTQSEAAPHGTAANPTPDPWPRVMERQREAAGNAGNPVGAKGVGQGAVKGGHGTLPLPQGQGSLRPTPRRGLT